MEENEDQYKKWRGNMKENIENWDKYEQKTDKEERKGQNKIKRKNKRNTNDKERST